MDGFSVGVESKTWKEAAEVGETEWQTKGRGKGKTKGKEAEKMEEMSRTAVFNGYGEGVRAEDVLKHINGSFVQDVDDDSISEVYAYGKTYASGGAVRFKTARQMWKHLVTNKGENWKMYKDRKVYARPGSKEGEDVEKSKAVRKAVRAIYESEEGGIDHLKQETSADYKNGKVKFNGFVVAEWKELGEGKGILVWNERLPAAAAGHKALMAA
jgi:hypothetical protein